jgi:hypothetical protein
MDFITSKELEVILQDPRVSAVWRTRYLEIAKVLGETWGWAVLGPLEFKPEPQVFDYEKPQ